MVSEGGCGGYSHLVGSDDLTATEACAWCGGGTCSTQQKSSKTETGHFEYNKPAYHSTS